MEILMKRYILFFFAILALVSFALAQDQPPQPPPPPAGHHHEMGADRQKMDDMHKKHMEAMQADLDKMKASLDQMKANVAKISDSNEKARWQDNIDLWTAMTGHMEHMMKHMDDMGSCMGTGHHHGMGDHPAPPPPDKKPE
jgi:hypothetical protein